jgi:hypothetical protein
MLFMTFPVLFFQLPFDHLAINVSGQFFIKFDFILIYDQAVIISLFAVNDAL